ncbi:MAG: hypothetical protein KatS3mg110_0637 [Pirellulaceae bacterium]|nr:MAG: hypothetical protein KatS3mg110_0637 [Pirellulaceae bacterium]
MHRIITAVGLVGLCLSAVLLFGQETKPRRYPAVDMCIWYEIDPNWPQKPAAFQWEAVSGVFVDRQDNVWMFTRSVPPVQVYSPEGKLIRAWGEDTVKTAHHMKIDHEGFVWLADIGYHTVRKYSPDGQLLLTLGTPGEAGDDTAHFNQPTDMAVLPSGDVFVSDGYGNNRVVHFDRHGKFVKQWGELGQKPGQFSLPHAIAADSQGRLYVADRNNVRVQVFDTSGKFLTEWRNVVTPWGLWVTADDQIWVCGSSPMPWYDYAVLGCPPKDQLVMRFDSHGCLRQLWTIPKGIDGQERPGELNWVHCLAIDSKGNLYCGDIIGKRLQKFIRRGPGVE